MILQSHILTTTVSVITIGAHETVRLEAVAPAPRLMFPRPTNKQVSVIAEKGHCTLVNKCEDLEQLMGVLIIPNKEEKRGPSLPKIEAITPSDSVRPNENQEINLIINNLGILHFKVGSTENELASHILKRFQIEEIDSNSIRICQKNDSLPIPDKDLVYCMHLISNHLLKSVDAIVSKIQITVTPGQSALATLRKLKSAGIIVSDERPKPTLLSGQFLDI